MQNNNKSIREILNHRKGTLFIKRTFDIISSSIALVLLSIPMLCIALLIKRDSPGPAIFKQERIGKNKKPFYIMKFRTMVKDANKGEKNLTLKDDPRITKVGKFLRRSKLDELPQLINVFLGDMSVVGPRPETNKYIEMYRDYPDEVFFVRPGITDLASIEYRDETEHFENEEQSEEIYLTKILPHKIELKLKYIRNLSVWEDIKIIFTTLIKIVTH